MGTWKHRSTRYPAWSSIPWGSGLRKNASNVLEVHVDGAWRPLSDFSPVDEAQIVERYLELYGESKLPSSWVFNDFGHITAFMFVDKNRNSRFDKDAENVHGEFFHTTPDNEAQVARGLPVALQESHGCIHMHPTEFDGMISRGYFKRGVVVHIHPYTKDAPSLPVDPTGKAPFTLHFFPKSHSILVFGR